MWPRVLNRLVLKASICVRESSRLTALSYFILDGEADLSLWSVCFCGVSKGVRIGPKAG